MMEAPSANSRDTKMYFCTFITRFRSFFINALNRLCVCIGSQIHVYVNVCEYVCMYVWRCGYLYLVGIRPVALVLITACCLRRPCNVLPLICGFRKKKKSITPLVLIVYSLTFIQPTVEVSFSRWLHPAIRLL